MNIYIHLLFKLTIPRQFNINCIYSLNKFHVTYTAHIQNIYAHAHMRAYTIRTFDKLNLYCINTHLLYNLKIHMILDIQINDFIII